MKRAGWTAVAFHVAALVLSVFFLEPVFQGELPRDPALWGAAELVGWRACWIIWIAAVLLFIRLLFLAETRPRIFTERWYPLYRHGSLGIANSFYASSVLGLSLRLRRAPGVPAWLEYYGIVVFFAAIPLTIAGFLNLTRWDDTVSGVFFALFLPWMLVLAYKRSSSRAQAAIF